MVVSSMVGERRDSVDMVVCLEEKTAFAIRELFRLTLGALGEVSVVVERARLRGPRACFHGIVL
jgi:hypothetical protein